MMRSLFSGVAGLKTHQTKMDVIGNNIANVNTVGYKSQSVAFSDVLYQTTQGASGPNSETGRGGVNAKQIGLGSMVAAMSTSVASAGGAQATNNPFDLMINGDSMFIVNNGTDTFFTRAGNFTKDSNGNLVTSSGYNVMGYKADDEGVIMKTTVKPLSVFGDEYKYAEPEPTTDCTLSGNINKEDESFSSATGSRSVNVAFYDCLGYEYIATIAVTQADNTGFNYNMAVSQVTCEGKKLEGDFSNMLEPTTLQFDTETGAILTDSSFFTINSGMLGDSFNNSPSVRVDTSNVTCKAADTSLISGKGIQDGEGSVSGAGRFVGEMTSVSIQTDGKIVGSYSNGDIRVLGQIAVATFVNLAGLEKAGDNLYTQTLNSGEFDGIGSDITAVGGKFSPGYVEMSNVDLSQEFTDMITTQRGFQANSRIITVSDTLIEELVNLKR